MNTEAATSGRPTSHEFLGKKVGLLTLLGDLSKGVAAVVIASHLLELHWQIAVSGLMVFIGHVYPVFLKFKGGKGVATGLGVFLFSDALGYFYRDGSVCGDVMGFWFCLLEFRSRVPVSPPLRDILPISAGIHGRIRHRGPHCVAPASRKPATDSGWKRVQVLEKIEFDKTFPENIMAGPK